MSPPPSSSSSDYGSDINLPDLDGHDSSTTAVASGSDYGSDIDLTDIDLLNLLDDPAHLYPPLPHYDFPARPPNQAPLVVQYETEPPQTSPTPTLPTISPAQPEMEAADTSPPLPGRSPYERFRSRRGRLSVTDLVSGVWCEQQFMYTLETGFKRNTPAMRRGTRLHKVLEEEVHTTVPVTVKTKEDQWGLKLFNICQGLQSLAEYGMTRELEVFGWLDGIFISGVIDEITYDHPRPDGVEVEVEAGTEATETPSDDESFTTCPDDVPKVVYITDTKTRMTPTVPKQSQQLSASLQLTFYHTLLASLPSVPFNEVIAHHNLSPTARFSDTFIAQIASMQSTISLQDLLDNNSLPGMWSLVLSQYAKTIDSIGDTVGVTYRFQGNGEVIAERSWRVEEDVRERHLDDVMQWWKGERTTRGVAIEEAWKCSMCEFQEGCTWRLGKLEETRRKARDSFAANEKVEPRDKVEINEDALKTVERVRRGRKAAGEAVASDSDTNKEEKPRRRRSKKNKDIATTATSDEAVQVVKRGRGRPRKDENAAVNAATSTTTTTGKEAQVVKRARGRPGRDSNIDPS
ncbi:hypothetical protein P167DRAFT_525191 [Morchella conica CCBAS932]|uniref:Exonuclease V n=1 Tax=Morchella conica CCBAS932 TaxID=1392247 RepID=A0A3N4KNN3_9PEZI|nr:hypothetical protein P167DRAFT_525191 [Morchella conica CCBAS932]